jgi:hypothetical protein
MKNAETISNSQKVLSLSPFLSQTALGSGMLPQEQG